MKNSENSRSFLATGALWVAAGMTVVACSKGDTVSNGNTAPQLPVTTCGSLDATQAAQIATSRLDHLGSVGLAALAGLENSRVVARLVSFGNSNVIDPFVDDGQSDLHDALVKLRDEQLIAANVEKNSGASVTFLLSAETQCESSAVPTSPIVAVGGAGGVGGSATTGGSSTYVDTSCVAQEQAHPTRIRISRVACDQGDNVALELISGTAQERVLLANLYAERAEGQLDLGAMLRQSYSTSVSTPTSPVGSTTPSVTTRTEKPVVSSAAGILQGTLTLTSTNQANGSISVAQAIDITFADESAVRLQVAAGTNVATIVGDGGAKTIKVTANGGAFDWRSKFQYFISDFFGLQTSPSATTQNPVDIHVAGLRGSLNFDGNTDTIVAEGLDLGGAVATAKQAGATLLSVDALSAAKGAIAATFTGRADDSLGVALTNGLGVEIHYGLQPVMSMIDNPANFLASDTMTVGSTADSSLTLWRDASTNDLTVATSQTGTLLRVDSGSLSITSSGWPNDTVSVSPTQCLSRTSTSQSGHHDLLDDFTVGACPQ
jgi:hypothetical protein